MCCGGRGQREVLGLQGTWYASCSSQLCTVVWDYRQSLDPHCQPPKLERLRHQKGGNGDDYDGFLVSGGSLYVP